MSIGSGRAARYALPFVFALTALSVFAPGASAQYFGRNKVQYENFDFSVLKTEHFNIHFYPEEREMTLDAARMSERWNARLSPLFQHRLSEVKPIIFYANHPDFQQTNVGGGGFIDESTGGFTEGLRTRLVMPFTSAYRETDHVLGHEMVHVFQYDVAAGRSGMGIGAMNRLPGWLIEGMAEYLSLGRNDPNTAMWLRDAALRGDLPNLEQLGRDARYFPYRYGQALWAYIGGRWGDRTVTELYRFALREGMEAAMRRVLGVTSKQLSDEWIASIRTTYLPLVEGRTRPADAGDHVLGSNELGEFNLDPVISPDGKYVAFFSSRGLFSIDLFVADAATGKVIKRLTSPTTNSHVDAVAFIYSAGSWSPDGKKFAFTVFANGDQELQILDVESRNVERTVDVKGVGQVDNPSWSPDGKSIVFSGNAGGISDLYLLDLQAETVTKLTSDKYADLQPDWSPDGRTIAFVTDRGDRTNFTDLTFGEYRIALMNVADRSVRLLGGFETGKHINPQFSPDGRSVYFISDRDGFSDIYREDIATGDIYQVTRLATAVSGIASASPAMSVAAQTGRVMFSVFQNSGYNIYGLNADRAQGTLVQRGGAVVAGANLGGAAPTEPVAPGGILPPVAAMNTSVIVNYLADPVTGLPVNPTYAVTDYKPGLRLDYLGQPSFGVGSSSFGTVVGGSASAFFSDMLGNHNLGVAVQAQGQVKDIGGQVFYQNASRRWNMAAVGGHIPYLSGFAGVYFDERSVNGRPTPVQIVQQLLLRTYYDQAMLLAAYPFSQTRRFEFSGGYNHIGYDYETKNFFYTLGGQFLGDSTAAFPRCTGDIQFNNYTCTPSGIHLATASAAFVGDNSFFGFTSPIQGKRYRIEVSPTAGTLQFMTGLLDYRNYLFFKPVTLALRGLHYGRYGRDANDYRQQPLFLGYQFWVRGYESGSFNGNECLNAIQRDPFTGQVLTTTATCPAFDRLIGSRIVVANLELRMPLFGTERFGLINFPFFPTEIAPFIDAGLAWGCKTARTAAGEEIEGSCQEPSLRFDRNTTDRVPVFSAGISSRINVLGYVVMEVYYAYPFQRPERGGHFGFQIQPGW